MGRREEVGIPRRITAGRGEGSCEFVVQEG